MDIYRAYVCNTDFFFIKVVWMCGNKEAMNDSLCCTSDIWKMTLAINFLNLSSKSKTDFVESCFISLILVIHCDSYFSLLNSSTNLSQILFSFFGTTPTGTMEKFIYHPSAQPRRVLIICTFFISSSWICRTIYMMSPRNQCFSWSSSPFPLNIGSLILVPACDHNAMSFQVLYMYVCLTNVNLWTYAPWNTIIAQIYGVDLWTHPQWNIYVSFMIQIDKYQAKPQYSPTMCRKFYNVCFNIWTYAPWNLYVIFMIQTDK